MGLALIVALAPLLLVGVTAAAVPTDAPLVVASTRSETPPFHHDVFLVDAVTATTRNLTRHPASDRAPVASPDGRHIAFISDRTGGDAIWVVPTSGGAARQVSRELGRGDTLWLADLVWRPDGGALAYYWSGTEDYGVGVVTTAGRTLLHRHEGLRLAWLTGNRLAVQARNTVVIHDPRGRVAARRQGLLVAASRRGHLALQHGGRIHLHDPAGRRFARLAGSGGSWSPDGSLFALARRRGIWLVDSRGRVRLLSRTLRESRTWAPDGRSLLSYDKTGRTVVLGLDGRTHRVPYSYVAVWSPSGTLADASPRGIVVGKPGGRARVVARLGSGSGCDPRVENLAWIDGRRLVLSQGGGGQNDADLWLARSDGRYLRRLTSSGAWDARPAWSPDGRTIAYESGEPNTHADGCYGPTEPEVRLVSAAGRDLGALTTGISRNAAWSPDGKTIALERVSLDDVRESGIVVVDVATRQEQLLSRGESTSPSWSPDSTRIAFAQGGRVRVLTVATGESSPLVAGADPSWSPDGGRIAYFASGRLRLVAPAGGTATDLGPAPPGWGRILWARDGARLAVRTRRGILIAEPSGRRRLVPRPGEPLAWSPDGNRLLVTGFVGYYSRPAFNGSARTELFAVPAEGGPPRRLSRDLANVVGAAWRDG